MLRSPGYRPLIRAAFVIAAWAAISTCGSPTPEIRNAAPPVPSAPPIERSAGSVNAPSASAAPSAAPSASPPTSASAAASAGPPAAPLRTTTPGKIQCETVDCDLATEICCVDVTEGRCLAKSKAVGPSPCLKGTFLPAEVSKRMIQERRCDESADCRSGERCCEFAEYDDTCQPSTAARWRCATKCPSGREHSDEVCLRGSSCATGPCVVAPGVAESPLQGYCPGFTPELACGQSTCKGGDVCCWDPKAHTGRCAKPGTCNTKVETSEFACERPSDCGARFDCYNTTGMHGVEEYGCHQYRCSVNKLFAGPFLCDSAADCPVIVRHSGPTSSIKAYAPVRCRRSAEDPAGVKVCEY
ncbi:MAG: hypothetical protein HY898_16805 [Deltaproteobacteria bacterium]|nr:hypothetical protein [Deltaproteobacteria bacterium]